MGPEQLMQAAQAGEPAAAEELVECFYGRIYALHRRLTGNPADAADLTQRTFSRAWQALPGFAGRCSVGSWLHKIAYNLYLDWRRADQHRQTRHSEWWLAQVDPPAPDEQLITRDLAARLYLAVDKLEPVLRETLHLLYYQELSLEEVAAAMSVAASTVKYRRKMALKELQKEMAEPVAGLARTARAL
ncbi:MAG TPA: RNA polymerase sigma factor [Verrucomicrobiae bacterium]|nr:RNA polymerase sigma factor [Verrucomicrobiae bacterium]